MKNTPFEPKTKKLQLKRSKKKIVILPLFLFLLIVTLSLVSIYRHHVVRDLEANIMVSSDKVLSHNASLGEDQAQEGHNQTLPAANQTSLAGNAEEFPIQSQSQADCAQVIEDVVHAGETITGILSDYLTIPEIYVLNKQCQDVFCLRKIKSGQPYRLTLEKEQLREFAYEIDSEQKLLINFSQDGQYAVSKAKINYSIKTEVIQGEIQNSLFEAVKSSGESPALAVALADIFAWDIDFIRDIRKHDSFKLIVEKRYRKGLFENYGDILAAQFVNQGREFQAFRYTLSDRTEFFNAKGEAVRKTFLKAPLHFTRISSGYSLHRRHPILNVVRPHRGIDYAAPVGTPIKTVADGVVICRRYDRHAGRYVKVRHCNGYVTVYNHMSRFARDVKRGSRVEQGQVIGYVGSTGLSTGPHLDFRVKKNGHYLNPLKIKSEPAKPVPQQEMQAFQDTIKPLVAVLEGQKPYFAMFSKEENG